MNKIVEILKEIDISTIQYIEEEIDVQYKYIKDLVNNNVNVNKIIQNSLITYQLNCKGEIYWREFYEFMLNKRSDVMEFLNNSLCNKRLKKMKITRLLKAQNINVNFNFDFVDVWNMLEKYGFKKDYKTTVFAIKMFGYAKRGKLNKFIQFPMEIPIPVDSRIKKLTKNITHINPKMFWNMVAKKSDIPPLHIDSILWNLENKKLKEIESIKPLIEILIKR